MEEAPKSMCPPHGRFLAETHIYLACILFTKVECLYEGWVNESDCLDLLGWPASMSWAGYWGLRHLETYRTRDLMSYVGDEDRRAVYRGMVCKQNNERKNMKTHGYAESLLYCFFMAYLWHTRAFPCSSLRCSIYNFFDMNPIWSAL